MPGYYPCLLSSLFWFDDKEKGLAFLGLMEGGYSEAIDEGRNQLKEPARAGCDRFVFCLRSDVEQILDNNGDRLYCWVGEAESVLSVSINPAPVTELFAHKFTKELLESGYQGEIVSKYMRTSDSWDILFRFSVSLEEQDRLWLRMEYWVGWPEHVAAYFDYASARHADLDCLTRIFGQWKNLARNKETSSQLFRLETVWKGMMGWALAPGGPVVRIAKRSFNEICG